MNERFNPDLTPLQCLSLGVFEGRYLNNSMAEYPSDWSALAKLSDVPDEQINLLKIKSRMSRHDWKANGWIRIDKRGYFEWWCKYSLGRHCVDDDWQISRWRSFARHRGQVLKGGHADPNHRRKQRQALLQWGYDPFPDMQTLSGESVYEKCIRISCLVR